MTTTRMILTAGPVQGTITGKDGEAVTATAIFSPCKQYRYRLTRSWDEDLLVGAPRRRKTILFIMLNPSTATENVDDPTIRKIQKFSRKWGYNRLLIGNAFAWRDKDPEAMKRVPHPVGPDNDAHIIAMAKDAEKIIVAWGKHATHKNRGYELACRLSKAGFDLFCLGTNNDGTPCHPLYLKDTTEPFYYGPDLFAPVG